MKKIIISFIFIILSITCFADIYSFEWDTTFDKLLKANKPILIDFGGKMCVDCVPCHDLFERKNKEYNKKALIKYVDIQKNKDFAKRMGVELVPCQSFWTKKGKPYIPSKKVKTKFEFLKDKKGMVYRTIHYGVLTESEFEIIIRELI